MDALSSTFPFIYHAFGDLYFHPHDVSFILMRLNPSTSKPCDGISQIVYKRYHHSFSKPLAYLFNLSLLLGDIPQMWKEAIVTAILKTPGTNLLKKFRSISLAQTAIKVMKKCQGEIAIVTQQI